MEAVSANAGFGELARERKHLGEAGLAPMKRRVEQAT